jgi:hypothetical protein
VKPLGTWIDIEAAEDFVAANPFNIGHHIEQGYDLYSKWYYDEELTQEDREGFFYAALWHVPPVAAHILIRMGLIVAEPVGYFRSAYAVGATPHIAFGLAALEVLPSGDVDTGLMDPESTILYDAAEFITEQWWKSIEKKDTGWELFEYNR